MPRWGLLKESRRFEWWTPYGDTEEEAVANYLRRGAGCNTDPWAIPDFLERTTTDSPKRRPAKKK